MICVESYQLADAKLMGTIKNSMPKAGFGCFILFALPFAAVGVGMSAWLGSEIVAHYRMQSWKETPAKIVQAKLESSTDSDGSTTCQATAEYTYQYNGRQYTGHRVSVHGGSDNIGSFQQNVHRQLSEHKQSRRPFHCYVNPTNSSEAILFRDLRWEMVCFKAVFATIFGSAGFGLLAFAMFGYRKAKKDGSLAALHPEEPWLCKADWATGKIKSSSGSSALFMLAFTFFWNVISAPALFVFLTEIHGKNSPWAYFALIFPATGLILILCTIVAVRRWRKYGRSVFEMASVPGVIGGQLAGVIRVSTKVEPEDGFRVALNCVQITITSGENGGRSESVVWQDEQVIARELQQNDPKQSAIPILFQIPYECRPTDETSDTSQTIWRLNVSAKTPGLDYSTSFDVPVFKTPESDPNFVVDRSLIAEYVAPDNPERDLREAGLLKTESPTGEGIRLVFPMARAPGFAAVMTLTTVLFGGVPFVIYYMDSGFSFVSIPFIVIFGLLGLFLLMATVDIWFYRSVIDASPNGLTIVGGLFGIGREQQIEAADIKEIVLRNRMSSGEGQSKKMYYDLDIVCKSGKKITAGKRVFGKRIAESVIRQIAQALGKDESICGIPTSDFPRNRP